MTDIIQLANDIMNDYRINGKVEVTSYGTYYNLQSRLGILKTELSFKDAISVIDESLKLLNREYGISYSCNGMYYSLSQRK